MAKLFKILGVFIGVVLLLVVAASLILPLVVDPNDFKGVIVKQVKEHTGRDLKISGDLDLSVFPWLGVTTEGVELSNARGFGSEPFAAVRRAAVRVKLRPLLDKRLEVDAITLDGVTLNLIRAKSGAGNWDDLAQGGGKKAKAVKDGPQDKQESGKALAGFSIEGVEVRDASISWDDRKSGQKYTISELSLTSGAIAPGRPVGVELSMLLQSSEPALKAQVGLAGTMQVDDAQKLFGMNDLRLSVDAQGADLPNGRLKADLATAFSMSMDGDRIVLQGLHLTSGSLDLKGNLNGSRLGSGSPLINGSLELAEFNPREWMVSQGMQVPATSDPKALERLAASLNLVAKGTSTNLDKLVIRLDDTRVTGNAVIKGNGTDFKLNVDSLNLDRYASAGKGGEQAAGPAGKGQSGKPSDAGELLPVADLRKLNLSGSVDIGRLTTGGLQAEKVRFTMKAKDGLVQTTQKVGAFYQGSYNGSVTVNVKGKSPLIDINSNLSKVHMGSMIQRLAGQDRLSGQGSFQANLRARGNSVKALKRNLNGKLNFKFLEGAVKGINLAAELRKAKALLSGKPVAASSGPVQTDFSQITGSGVIKQGVLHSRDLEALSPFIRVSGKGAVNLVSETLDYTTEVFIVETSKGQGGHDMAALEELKRKKIGVPVRFTGPLAAPKWDVQWQKVLLETQKEKLKSALEKKLLGRDDKGGAEGKESSKDSAKRKLKEQLLKGLFK
jgi:AsmA protein